MRKKTKNLLFNCLFFILCLALAYGISEYVFDTISIEGYSMEQTLFDGDKIILYKRGKYEVGDIVVFNTHKKNAEGNDRYLVKRIIGLPGDTIEIKYDPQDSQLYTYRNGEKIIEDYINPERPMYQEMERVTVPTGEFFYMGDNRGVSGDSRFGEMGRLDSIMGRAILRYNTSERDINIIKRLIITQVGDFYFNF
ncbi:MAG: signal peptidase I [Clostridia bacterium]